MNRLNRQITKSPNRQIRRSRAAFTLIEAALATVIVGTGVLSIMAAQQAYHIKNNWAARESTAVLLAGEIRELMIALPAHDPVTYLDTVGPENGEFVTGDPHATLLLLDDVDDFAGDTDLSGNFQGMTLSPPVDARRQQLADLANWTQTVTVTNVLPDNVSVSDAFTQPLGTTDVMRVSVVVSYTDPNDNSSTDIVEMTWLISD